MSQSLHGLIFADSLLIPNVWLDFGSIHIGGQFKFYDYFSTVGRPCYKKCKDNSLGEEEMLRNVFLVDGRVIRKLKNDVSHAFEGVINF